MNKITDYRRGGVHPRPFGCKNQGVVRSARESGQPQGIAPAVFAWVLWDAVFSVVDV